MEIYKKIAQYYLNNFYHTDTHKQSLVIANNTPAAETEIKGTESRCVRLLYKSI